NDKPLVSDQISQEVDSNEGGNESLEEEWHAPTDFSLESTNSTLKKNAENRLRIAGDRHRETI
ncbi:4277_t:CDS:2, partial [Entrophospora sp. SA101]